MSAIVEVTMPHDKKYCVYVSHETGKAMSVDAVCQRRSGKNGFCRQIWFDGVGQKMSPLVARVIRAATASIATTGDRSDG